MRSAPVTARGSVFSDQSRRKVPLPNERALSNACVVGAAQEILLAGKAPTLKKPKTNDRRGTPERASIFPVRRTHPGVVRERSACPARGENAENMLTDAQPSW